MPLLSLCLKGLTGGWIGFRAVPMCFWEFRIRSDLHRLDIRYKENCFKKYDTHFITLTNQIVRRIEITTIYSSLLKVDKSMSLLKIKQNVEAKKCYLITTYDKIISGNRSGKKRRRLFRSLSRVNNII